MADIFISYSREDREWVSKLADALQAEGYSVWWDWDLLVGKRYRETIETELQVCKATVVVWSQHSVHSDFVRDEAEEGQQRNILVPILKESVRPPAGFRQLQTADFSTWTGGTAHAEYQRMIKGLSHLIGRDGTSAAAHVDAAPAPSAPSPVVEPTRPAPVVEPDPAPAPVPDRVLPSAPVVPTPAPAVQAKVSEPAPAHTSVLGTSPPPMTAPKKPMPVLAYVAIGGVALIALAFVVMFVSAQFTHAPKPVPPPVTAGPAPQAMPAAAAAHPATPAPSGAADNGGGSGTGGDEAGNSGAATPPAGGTPAPAAPDSGGQDAGGDSGQDVGQGH